MSSYISPCLKSEKRGICVFARHIVQKLRHFGGYQADCLDYNAQWVLLLCQVVLCISLCTSSAGGFQHESCDSLLTCLCVRHIAAWCLPETLRNRVHHACAFLLLSAMFCKLSSVLIILTSFFLQVTKFAHTHLQ